MNKNIVVIIPARCGSKRIRMKNIRDLGGRPLLAHSVQTAIKAGVDGGVWVSTDCDEVATVAVRHGAGVIKRPWELADDTASTESALLHALDRLEEDGLSFSWVMTLPPTSPLRTARTVCRAARIALKAEASLDAVFTVHEHRGDFWRGDPGGPGFSRLYPDAPRRSQDRAPLWEENGALYLTRVRALRDTGFILGRTRRALPVPPLEGLDINTELDFKMAECLLSALSGEALP